MKIGMSQNFLFLLLCVLVPVVLVHAQNQSGFISIDCGVPVDTNYTDQTTGLNYISDANFIDAEVGESKSVLAKYKIGSPQPMWYLRSFPEGDRNCYKINVEKGNKYLIRASFLHGNYNGIGLLETPEFDLHLGVNFWDTLKITYVGFTYYSDIIHVPLQDYIHICLVKTGTAPPFISAIELRKLPSKSYDTKFGSLALSFRRDFGSTGFNSYRYNYDVYDRVWDPYMDPYNWTSIKVSNTSAISFNNSNTLFEPPIRAMSTAITPKNASAPLKLPNWQGNETELYHVYMHFAEIEILRKNETRQFNILLNGFLQYENFTPSYMMTDTLYSTKGFNLNDYNFSLEMTEESNLPPIINAIEAYKIIELQQPDTNQGDVEAITTIKSNYGIKKNWQGDPCNPVDYLWEGVNCSYDGFNPPRITSLSLSASGLKGNISSSIRRLSMLEYLDLSNNSLQGPIPDILSQLQHLRTLKLDNNNLTGSTPSALAERANNGSLSLSVSQNPYLCGPAACNGNSTDNTKNITSNHRSNKKVIVPLVASIAVLSVVLVALTATLWVVIRRKSRVQKDPDGMTIEVKKRKYSYSEVLKITDNFSRTIGKGGFGAVYLGCINGNQVAVKMLSPSSVQGHQQFQAEVKLLMRVHHRNLTSLIGYCNEKNNMGLIYEYMANGDLYEHLTGKDSEGKLLPWEERLRIAVDAAQGLEYLHNGCKPPIIHRDIKTTNILLNENFQAKLADFGLSKIIPMEGGTHVSTVVAGTPGYLDPEYYTSNRLTEKSDVYSFGVVILEIITSQPAIARNQENTHISKWVSSRLNEGDIRSIIDSRLQGDFDINSAWKAVEIGMACVAPTSNKRPNMSEVVMELKECLAAELARTEHSGVNTGYSVDKFNLNLITEHSPMAT